ncbi:putative metallophosphoesterase YhaO [Thalassovita gelatinovora]|uniref:Putative metallophosphoesterase YhaO n=1 Tax=Thalassovita gelatinovora TaxID=53501 RepID=A0A0N7LUV2_THAGE|nr:DNA repair exonuclease [Thalassovita gelatinovora]QIZ81309.1 DNA repair exonuclease [Thalassovita gelatinovora]CUH64530.1 putative metallophosphoesterase YhaO [Thalassovita gelatinovora]SEP96825.1 DNA repair exonuclease SbcCD nuclease subunit [Thalassovita gelatinovora]
MAFKFVHTADIHLDSPLKSLALRDAELAEIVGNATRTTLSRIVDLCLAEQVQALVIAGDLYDGGQTSMKTARFLAQELERLTAAGILAFVIRGNHDAASKITRELVLPDAVRVFSDRAEVVEVSWNGHAVAVHGISFRQPHAPDSLLDQFHPPVPGAFNIGLLHTSLAGTSGHDPYAPCALAELQQMGFDYWALGHIHKRAVHPGATTVVMPGIPQGRDIGEAGPKSVTLVSVNDDGAVSLQERHLATAQFERITVDCNMAADWGEVVEALKQALKTARQDNEGEHLIVRPVLEGKSQMAWRAHRDADLLGAEAQVVAEQIGSLWIDKVEIALQPGEGSKPGGAVGEMAALVTEGPLRADDPRVKAELDLILKHLPRELRGIIGDNEEQVITTLNDTMQRGAMDVLARLEDSEG